MYGRSLQCNSIKHKIMTVQELINALNKIEDKSKIVHQYDEEDIDEVVERINGDVVLY